MNAGDAHAAQRQATAANYDRLSRWYDLLSGRAERRLSLECVSMLDLRAGDRALEIGPGTGHALLALARAVGPEGSAWGLDLSVGMLALAQKRVARGGPGGCIALAQGDALRLPFQGESLDALLATFVLELFREDEMGLALAECRRVLRPDGRLGVVSMAATQRPGPMSRLYAWAHRRWPQVIDCRPIDLVAELGRCGFAVTRAQRRSIWSLPVTLAVARRR